MEYRQTLAGSGNTFESHCRKKSPETTATLLPYIGHDHLPVKHSGNCQTCPTAPNCVPVYD